MLMQRDYKLVVEAKLIWRTFQKHEPHTPPLDPKSMHNPKAIQAPPLLLIPQLQNL